MWTSLALAALVLAQPEPCRLQDGADPPREPADVAAVSCWGRPGFFVPSLEYRRLVALERDGERLALSLRESEQLRVALSAAETSALRWREVADRDRADKLELARERDELAQRLADDSPASWFAIGAGVGSAAAVAIVVGLALFFNAVPGAR